MICPDGLQVAFRRTRDIQYVICTHGDRLIVFKCWGFIHDEQLILLFRGWDGGMWQATRQVVASTMVSGLILINNYLLISSPRCN
jgi:hypothetical protein